MARKTNSKISLVVTFAVIAVLGLAFVATKRDSTFEAKADNVDTSVTVSNTAPVFDVGGDPYEEVASFSGTPTDVDEALTFRATGDDSNDDDYYLAVCKTNAVTAVDGAAPTCNGGAWCVSSATTDQTEANCNYTMQASDTSESYAWFAFVCDDTPAGSACSTAAQGSGNDGSPFYVNHRPLFTAITDDGGSGANSGDNPGGTIQFTATASDSDSDDAADTVELVVCGAAGVTNKVCNSQPLCSSTSASSNPSCTYNIPSVRQDANYSYWAYVFDNHDLASVSNPRTGQYVVTNVAPVVTSVVLNGGSDITLTENTTTDVQYVTATVTDVNSCQDLDTVTTSLYRAAASGAFANCDQVGEANNNNCYPVVSCVVAPSNTCDSATDSVADYRCTVSVQYHADPTDNATITPPFEAHEWYGSIEATDDSAAQHDDESSPVEMLSLTALNVTSTLSYGSHDKGTDTGAVNYSTTVTSTGNTGIDTDLAGSNMCLTSYPACPGDQIAVGQQEYSDSTFTWGSGLDLTGSAVELELNLGKTIVTGSPLTKDIQWGIGIPTGISSGTYYGANTVVAVMGEVLTANNW
jgi:hypothetical protein